MNKDGIWMVPAAVSCIVSTMLVGWIVIGDLGLDRDAPAGLLILVAIVLLAVNGLSIYFFWINKEANWLKLLQK